MSKIIVTNTEKIEFEAHQILNCEVDFTVVKKGTDKYQIRTNTDKGLVTIELNNQEIKKLLKNVEEILN